VYVVYLLFRVPPHPARALIRVNNRISTVFQKVGLVQCSMGV